MAIAIVQLPSIRSYIHCFVIAVIVDIVMLLAVGHCDETKIQYSNTYVLDIVLYCIEKKKRALTIHVWRISIM